MKQILNGFGFHGLLFSVVTFEGLLCKAAATHGKDAKPKMD